MAVAAGAVAVAAAVVVGAGKQTGRQTSIQTRQASQGAQVRLASIATGIASAILAVAVQQQ